jgi:XTP/dITP diphosphohydrolase
VTPSAAATLFAATLFAATRSAGKQREIRRIIEPAGVRVLFPHDLGLAESAAEEALETAETFEDNTRRKAEYFARLVDLPTVADDSGLEVLALGGAPGVRSRRWAGASGTAGEVDAANNAELLRRLAGKAPEERKARYRCVLAFLSARDAVPEFFEGTCTGVVLDAPRGTGGFGYDPFFLSDDLGLTFGEATAEAKDAVSHRGRALRAFAAAQKRGSATARRT